MRVDRPLVGVEGDAVERVEELGAGEDPAGPGGHRRQQPEFGRGEVDDRAGHLGPHPGHVEDDVAGVDRLGRLGRAVRAAEDGADAGDELARAERLGQVVVGAELEAEQLVELVVAGREHDDRDGRVAAQLAGDVEAVEAGQAEVEDDEVGASLADGRERAGPSPAVSTANPACSR